MGRTGLQEKRRIANGSGHLGATLTRAGSDGNPKLPNKLTILTRTRFRRQLRSWRLSLKRRVAYISGVLVAADAQVAGRRRGRLLGLMRFVASVAE